jgi:hypothetical protein
MGTGGKKAMAARLGRVPGIGRLLQALGVNAVPAAGYFGQGWSIGTTLALYWLETALVTVLVALRIVLHRRSTRKAGHWNVPIETRTTKSGKTRVRRGTTTFLASFLTIMGVFTAAHGLFLGALVLIVLPGQAGPDAAVALADVETGIKAMAVFLALGLALDLIALRDRPFRWIERMAERAQGRMFVTHLTIIFGMGAMAIFEAPAALAGVFVAFKTLVDFGSLLPEREEMPDPPRWLAWLDRFGPTKDGQNFSAHYRKSVEEERRKRDANERVLDDRS